MTMVAMNTMMVMMINLAFNLMTMVVIKLVVISIKIQSRGVTTAAPSALKPQKYDDDVDGDDGDYDHDHDGDDDGGKDDDNEAGAGARSS